MKVKIDKSFERDTDKLSDKKLSRKIAVCIEAVQNCRSLNEISNLKKLQGSKNYYRIRIGDYRVGIFVNGNEIIFERFLHRKEIYRFYP